MRVAGPPPKKYCCVCGAYGHRAEQCYDSRLLLQTDVISSEIKNYEKFYANLTIDNSTCAPYSMFDSPRDNFKFVWNVNESKDRVYGRFMEATNIKRNADVVIPERPKKIPKLDEKLVLNPMNVQNVREKPKKQFSKNFYEESPSKQNRIDKQIEVTKHSKIVADNCETETSRVISDTFEHVDHDNDVVMKDVGTTVDINDSVNKPNDANKLMQEAIEVDQLCGPKNFSFTEGISGLQQSKGSFDLSFISNTDNQEHIDDSPKLTKTRARKLRDEAEIERLMEVEISLNKFKDKLTKAPPTNDIVLNVTNTSDHAVHDSDSNYSFSEFFNDAKSKDKITESPDFIPLPPEIDSSDIAEASKAEEKASMNSDRAVNSAKIHLTKDHARFILSTEAGNKMLSDASVTHQVKVRMDWENVGNVLIVCGTRANQNKFHADLIKFLVEMSKKIRIKNETFQQIPKGKVALIKFIRDQFALLSTVPLGNVNELYKNMKRNENLQSKNGTKNADRSRKNLNIILMGRAGLRDGRLHLTGLESNLKFLLENNKEFITRQTREEIYQHYRYVFSPFVHDDYPDLISQYEEMKRAKSFPPLNIDKKLLEFKISVKDDKGVDLNRAKQKLMRCANGTESPKKNSQESVESGSKIEIKSMPEPKTPTRELKTPKRDAKTPKSESKATKNIESTDLAASSSLDNSSDLHKNAVWSLKCIEIIEKCRQREIKSSKVVDKLNTVLEKASRNQLTYGDFKNLEQILHTLNKFK